MATAIARYVTGEGNDFADLRGAQTNDDGTYIYYDSSLQIPGSSACVIYIYKTSGDRFGTCDFNAPTLNDAKHLYASLTKLIQKAEPGWTISPIDPPPHGHDAALTAQDPQNTRGIYLYVAKSDDGKSYRVTTTFGTPSALKS